MSNKRFTESVFWKNYGMTIICFVLAICVLVVGMILRNGWTKKIETVQREKADVATQAQLEENRQVQAVKETAQSMVREVSGIDFSRKAKDDKLAEAFIKYATEWESYDTYVSSREEFKAKYPYIDESSYYLSKFFPPADSMIIRDASNAVVYNMFDNGRNIHFDTLESYVMNISDDGVYSYFAEIMCHSDLSRGKRGTSHMVALYSIDADGKFSGVTAYVLTH